MMPFGTLGYIVATAAVLGLIYALFQFVDSHWETSAGISKGESKKQAEWDKKNREADQAAEVQRAADELLAKTHAAELAAANRRADEADAKWRLERAKRPPLASCVPSVPGNVGDVPTPPRVVFTPGFVRLYDGVWTDKSGQPIFPYLSAGAQPPPSSASTAAVDADRLLDVHGENAQLCSKDRRALDALIDQIKALQEGWKLDTSCAGP